MRCNTINDRIKIRWRIFFLKRAPKQSKTMIAGNPKTWRQHKASAASIGLAGIYFIAGSNTSGSLAVSPAPTFRLLLETFTFI
jgi:hypothetical protein